MILLWCMTIFVTSLLFFEFSDLQAVISTIEVPFNLGLLLHFNPLNSKLDLVIYIVLCLHY